MTAQVYVGTYEKYNAGSIAGEWINLEQIGSYDDFLTACRDLHSDEADPELMLQDFEGFPERYYSESGLDADLWDYLALADDDKAMLEAYLDAGFDGDFEDAQDAFCGQFESDEDFARDMLDNTGGLDAIPDNLRHYFDYEMFARDLMFDYSASNGYYFTNY